MAPKIVELKTLEDVYEQMVKPEITPASIFSYSHPKRTGGKTVPLSIGRIWFNMLLPDKYPKLIDYAVDKKKAGDILTEIYELLPAEEAAAACTKISKECFKMTCLHPVTFGSEQLIVPDEIKKMKSERITKETKPDEFGTVLKEIADYYIENHMDDTSLKDIIKSKATGKLSPMDFAILAIAKGPTMDIEGNISDPIISGLMDGYNGKEYYTAAAEARRAYFIRGTGTAQPGYLARQVVFANANTGTSTKEDCGTTKFFELFVRSSMFSTILGRYYYNERTDKLVLITPEMEKKLVNTTILLRSPLYCKAKDGICPTCYGQLSKRLGTKNIGLIAGSVINDAGVEGLIIVPAHSNMC